MLITKQKSQQTVAKYNRTFFEAENIGLGSLKKKKKKRLAA